MVQRGAGMNDGGLRALKHITSLLEILGQPRQQQLFPFGVGVKDHNPATTTKLFLFNKASSLDDSKYNRYLNNPSLLTTNPV